MSDTPVYAPKRPSAPRSPVMVQHSGIVMVASARAPGVIPLQPKAAVRRPVAVNLAAKPTAA